MIEEKVDLKLYNFTVPIDLISSINDEVTNTKASHKRNLNEETTKKKQRNNGIETKN